MARIVSNGFSEKILVLEKSGLTVPKRPKIAQNGPKLTYVYVFLGNGSKEFHNFWHKVRGPKLVKTDGKRFVRKNPVLQNSGPRTRFGTEKSKFSKHRHMTPRWMQNCTRITKKIFSCHFALFGPKNGPKRVKKLQNDRNLEIFSFC